MHDDGSTQETDGQGHDGDTEEEVDSEPGEPDVEGGVSLGNSGLFKAIPVAEDYLYIKDKTDRRRSAKRYSKTALKAASNPL